MKRGLLLTGFWLVGVTASVALAFGAVGRVASHVAPQGVARLSAGAVDRELAAPVPSTAASTPHPTTPRSPSSTTSPTTRPSSPSSTTTTHPPPPIGPATSVPTTRPPSTVTPTTSTTTPHNTVTTSQGGTVWTRCVGAEAIAYVAAVPKSGYQRTHDLESAAGIAEWFDNGKHLSKITAECSDGSVHAEVEEENEGGD